MKSQHLYEAIGQGRGFDVAVTPGSRVSGNSVCPVIKVAGHCSSEVDLEFLGWRWYMLYSSSLKECSLPELLSEKDLMV
ncbi:hypothetical protein E2C01_001890 [Portunus trituberculatus]|uniref:Uncharacterized protein n=1 Tax=Portunus trituberculatus TaxID=210409 RepID=A0A5B7CKN4_PORTR|nr:hypothetical protein [Portunus trituberculatus]